MSRRTVPTAILVLSAFTNSARTAGDPLGNCNPAHDRLDPLSHKFVSSCADSMYCAPLNSSSRPSLAASRELSRPARALAHQHESDSKTGGTATVNPGGSCQPRLCRRDEFPFGFSPDQPLPPLCSRIGSSTPLFCPDNGSGCRPVLAPGSHCELARDEQCASTPSADTRSLCLNGVCTYANATLSAPCTIEETTYSFPSPFSGTLYTLSVTRHNCRSPLFHCDPSSLTCVHTKRLGDSCEDNSQCESATCEQAVCVKPVDAPNEIPGWQWAITITSIIVAMIMTAWFLIVVHRRHQYIKYKELREYYLEQISLRRSIIALHAALVNGNDGGEFRGRTVRKGSSL